MISRSQGGPRGMSVGGVLLSLLPVALFFLVFAAVGIVHVTSRVMVVDAGYRLSRLQQQGHELMQANDKLKLELATLKSPQKLERLAREQLGMATPSAASVINLGASSKPSAQKVSARAPVERALARAPSAGRDAP